MSKKKKDKPVSAEPEYFDDQFDLQEKENNHIPKRSGKEYFEKQRQRMYSQEEYDQKLIAHRRKIIARVLFGILAAAVIVLLCVAVRYFIVYSSYKVISQETRTSGDPVQYEEYYGKILRYSKDGASLYENKDKSLWNETYEMQDPMIDICGRYIVIAEKKGTNVCVFDLDGKKNAFKAAMPIEKVQISEKGTIALLLQKDEEHSIQYLDLEGNLIAEGKTVFEKSGYPLDISLSDDGFKLAVSYLVIENGVTKSNVAFYSFASIGATETDNIVSSQKYDNTVIPVVHYADAQKAVAFGNDRLVFFEGSQRPSVADEIPVKEEIKSVFYNEKYAGVVVADGEEMRMDVYDMKGSRVLSRKFDFEYDQIKVEKDRIIMYNSKQWCVYTMNGRQKLKPCDLSSPVSDIIALSSSRFILVKTNKTEIVRLKL